MNRLTLVAALALVAGLSGCDWMPGKPKIQDRWSSPLDVADFKTLYSQNCLACHGDGNSVAGSITLKNAVYLQIVPEATLRDVIANGLPGSNMPAFAKSAGGSLADSQIDTLVKGILAWRSPADSLPASIPPYAAPLGDVASGASAFGVSCAACHGADGKGAKAGSIVDAAYLGQVSDQYLRTVTIAGRPELGCPDFAHRVPGQPMSDQSVADIVAWLSSQRRNFSVPPVSP